jgi:hypothetical protein
MSKQFSVFGFQFSEKKELGAVIQTFLLETEN